VDTKVCCQAGAKIVFRASKERANQTAKAPLIASSANVAMPSPLAPERATLVAPMLPLPVWRMSSPRKCAPGHTRKGSSQQVRDYGDDEIEGDHEYAR